MEPLSEHGLISETAHGTFAFKNKIHAASIKLLWDKLSRFLTDALKQQKGVLVPNLGTFRVGPVVGESRKKVRPAFSLLETRYAGVSQERPKYSVGGRCAIIQPNYGLLATASALHRGACQRLLLELMQRLGVHILSGRPINVSFPGAGRLYTNKAGRIEFVFDTLLREYFELERERIIPEMEQGHSGALEEEPVVELVKGLQQVHIHNPPVIKDRLRAGPPKARPESPSSLVKRQAHAPYKGGLLDLYRLCKSNDRISSGCVPRLQLEQWLYQECASVLRQVAAATVLELLSVNTYGKTGKHVLYKPFLDQLEAAIGSASPADLSPGSMQSPRRIVEVRVDSPRQQAAPEVPLGPRRQPLYTPGMGRSGQQQHGEQQWQQPSEQQALDNDDEPGSEEQDIAEVTFSPGVAAAAWPPLALAIPQSPAYGFDAGAGPSPEPSNLPHHYYQHHMESSSRTAYDNFNRLHFEKLEQARGPHYKQRAVTPKVGQDELNMREYHAMRQAGERAVTPAQVLGLQSAERTPYSRGTPQPTTSANRQRGSPGPQPQILTLAHPTPAPQQPVYVPGLPPSYYQQPAQTPHLPRTPYQHGCPTPQAQQPQPWAQRVPSRQPTPSQQQQQQSSRPQPTTGSAAPPQNHYQSQQRQSASVQQTPQQQNLQPWSRGHTPAAAPEQLSSASPPISQYDIINEPDPVLRARKRNELATVLSKDWSDQIREKERVLQEIAVAEAQWPYAPTRQPNDKRPSSAVRRPPSPFLR